jgi:peptidoglycan/LPS O-acetylase OafA/YrhL
MVTNFRGIEHDVPLSLLYALTVYAAAYLAAVFALRVKLGTAPAVQGASPNRFGAIDSLRGLLALGVVTHHTLAGAAYFEGGAWGDGTNVFMNNLGRVGVGMFFMITGFLFTVKASGPAIDWPRFFRHRFLRLFPLYAVVVALVHFIVFALDGWQLRTTVFEGLLNAFDWLAFAIRHRPDINGHVHTEWIIAGVNWTLKYEVFFYVIATPLLHLGFRLLGRRVMGFVAVAACAFLYVANSMQVPNAHHFLNLFLGVLCAFVLPWLKPNLLVLKVLAVAAVIALFASELPLVIFCANVSIFLYMANLVHSEHVVRSAWVAPLQWIGEISYSIYLLHGVALYITYLSYGVGLTLSAFWGLALTIVASVVLLSSITFNCIEKPFMAWGKRLDKAEAKAVRTAAAAN